MPDVVRLSEGEALMPRKLRELRAELVKAGFKKVHQKGNHERWRHSLVPTYPVTLAGKDGDDARDYQEKQVRGAIHAAQEAERKRKP